MNVLVYPFSKQTEFDHGNATTTPHRPIHATTKKRHKIMGKQEACEYDKEMPRSQTTGQPTALRVRDKEHHEPRASKTQLK